MKSVALTDEQIRLILLIIEDAMEVECDEPGSEYQCLHSIHLNHEDALHLRDAKFAIENAERKTS